MDDFKFLPYIEGLVKAAKANPAPPFSELTVDQVREARNTAIKTLLGPGPEVARVAEEQIPVAGGQIALRLYYPQAGGPLPVMMWFHGGGWVVGGVETHDSLCRKLANKCGACLASVEYRLAPEHKFPTAIEDCYAATKWVAENAERLGLDASRLHLGGDSAGGGMVISVALLAKRRGGPAMAKLVSVYPVTDLASFDKPTYHTYWDKLILSGAAMEWFRAQFLGDPADGDDSLASPLLADDLAGLPPTLVFTAEHDVLTSDGEMMADRLKEAGVDCLYACSPGVIHLFLGMGQLNEQENGLNTVAEFLKS